MAAARLAQQSQDDGQATSRQQHRQETRQEEQEEDHELDSRRAGDNETSSAAEEPPFDYTESQYSEIDFQRLMHKHGITSLEQLGVAAPLQQPLPLSDTARRDRLPEAASSCEVADSQAKTTRHPSVNSASFTHITSEVNNIGLLLQRHSFPPDRERHRRSGLEPSPSVLQGDNSSSSIQQLCTSANNAAEQSDIAQPLRPLTWDDAEQRPLSAVPPPKRRPRSTMEYSQSPTQSNEGRSYDQYDDSPDRGSSSPGHRTLLDNDTGAVRFEFGRTGDTQITTGDSFNDEFEPVDSQPITEWPPKTQPVDAPDTSFSHQQDATSLAPETPAVVQRPFSFGGHAQAGVLPPSELFGQTQFTSAAKGASPTSSRPSPYIFNHNTISPNQPISSPLKDRGLRTSPVSNGLVSSPPFLRPSSRAHEPRTSQEVEEDIQPQDGRSSPELNAAPVKRSKLDPIEEYRSVTDFEVANSGQHQSSERADSDSDSDLADAARQRLARLKRIRAEKSLTSITFSRGQPQSHSRSSSTDEKPEDLPVRNPEDENVEVPSTNRARSKLAREYPEPSPTLGLIDTDEPDRERDSQETVADSQHVQVVAQVDPEPSGSAEQPSSPPARPSGIPMMGPELAAADTIPETSPACTAAEYPKRIADVRKQLPASNSTGSSLPAFPSTDRSGVEGQIRREAEATNNFTISSPLPPSIRSSPTVILASSQRMLTRSSKQSENVIEPDDTRRPPSSGSSSGTSSLSSLSATPPRPSSATPNTEHEIHELNDNVSSPAVAKLQRRGRPSSTAPKPRAGKQSVSPGSTSVASSCVSRASSSDAPAKSPNPKRGRLLKPLRLSKSRKSIRQTSAAQLSMQESSTSISGKEGLFKGMTFAVTFQSKQRNEDDDHFKIRVSRNKALKDTIIREGGDVLSDGFDALFRLESIHSRSHTKGALHHGGSMSLVSPDMGFTALIADEHSRKAKYIQALALGLPCLAPRWITTCVAKRKLVDWTSYLLCAGQSAFLGEAIRSRSLPYYDPTITKLSEVIEKRPKLLKDTEVLVVLKRTTKEDNMPYLFLVQILGATLTRVHTLDEARALLLQRQNEGRPFQWVYIGDRLSDADAVLYGPGRGGVTGGGKEASSTTSRKRKRQMKSSHVGDDGAAAADKDDGRPPKRVRALDDELVVQSLILGRLIEEDEMDL